MSYLDNPLVHRLGWTLIHTIWQDLAIAVLFAGILLAMRRASSGARYLAALAAFGAVALAPLVTFLVLPSERTSESAAGAAFTQPIALRLATATVEPGGWQGMLTRLEPLTPQFVGVWLFGMALMGLRLLGGLLLVERTRRLAVATPEGEWQGRLDELATRLGIRRRIQLMMSETEDVPSAIGVFRLAVLLPVSALSRLSPAQIEALLAHELAHIRRYDYLVNLLQSTVETAQFYHPAVWWISSIVRAERENCCDDLAVQALGDRIGYARALASLEELRVLSPQLAMTANGGSLMQRIKRILGAPARMTRGGFAWLPCIAAAALVVPFAAFAQTQKKAGSGEKNKKPELLVEVSADGLAKQLNKHMEQVLNDPDAVIVVDGKTKKVKDLSPSEKADLRQRMAQAAKDAARAMEEAKKAALEARKIAAERIALPALNSDWGWGDEEREAARGKELAEMAAKDADAQRRELDRMAADAERESKQNQDGAEIAKVQAERMAADLKRESERLAIADTHAAQMSTIEAQAEALAAQQDQAETEQEKSQLRKEMAELRRQIQELREQMRQQLGHREGAPFKFVPGPFDGKKFAEEFRRSFDPKMFKELDGQTFNFKMAKPFDEKKFAEEMAKHAKDWAKMREGFRKSFGDGTWNFAEPPMPPTPPDQTLKVDGDRIYIHKLPNGGYEIKIWKNGKAKTYKMKSLNFSPKAKALTLDGDKIMIQSLSLPGGDAFGMLEAPRAISVPGVPMGAAPGAISIPGMRILSVPKPAKAPQIRVYTAQPTLPRAPKPSSDLPAAPQGDRPADVPAPPSAEASTAATPSAEPQQELATSRIVSLPSFGRLL